MYVNPFIAGIILTLFVEAVLLIAVSIYKGGKK